MGRDPSETPALRVQRVNAAPLREERDYVLHWMIAQRRTRFNFGLQHAVHASRELGKPLLVLEALRCDYRWASDRLHRFVIDGMAENAERFGAAGVRYHPYVERRPGEGSGLLAALAERAALVVTDEFPCFFLPRMVAAAGRALDVRLEQVDANGILPLRATAHELPTAYAFRRFLQKNLREHLAAFPVADPLAFAAETRAVVARDVLERWPSVPAAALRGEDPAFLGALPIDHRVGVAPLRGGSAAGEAAQARFLDARLSSYDERNQPEAEVTSGLSPYLHFGHVGTHGVVADLLEREGWSPSALGKDASGKREGWWGTSAAAEAFLDQIVTWRELGYVFCWHRPDDYDRFDALPDWARATLTKHARDRREPSYSLAELEHAQTHDELWNAAQTQLVREGTIHNYLRMLWGKKILEWCDSPRRALASAIELNNKYALDGRNPNSYSGIFWTFGRFDRPWGPEREVFGTVRTMSSANTARKVRVKGYVAEKLTSGRGLFDPPAQ